MIDEVDALDGERPSFIGYFGDVRVVSDEATMIEKIRTVIVVAGLTATVLSLTGCPYFEFPIKQHLIGDPWLCSEFYSNPKPVRSHDDEHIIFEYQGGIFALDLRGEIIKQISEHEELDCTRSDPWSLDAGVDVSPTGNRVIFSTSRYFDSEARGDAEAWELVTMDFDGRDPIRLTYNTDTDWYRRPWANHARWSPGGSKIAYVYSRGADYQIHVIDSNGDTDVDVSSPFNAHHQLAAVWSPDGSKLLFVGYYQGYPAYMMVDLLDGKITKVSPTVVDRDANTYYRHSTPVWSVDGKKILFKRGERDQRVLVIRDLENYRQRTVLRLSDELRNLQWSPDETQVMFIAGGTGRNDGNVLVLDLNECTLIKLTRYYEVSGATWHSDNVISVLTSGEAILYTMNPDGTDKRVLVERQEDRVTSGHGKPLMGEIISEEMGYSNEFECMSIEEDRDVTRTAENRDSNVNHGD